MKIKVTRSELACGLKTVRTTVGSRTSGNTPILANVLLDAADGKLTLMTTNLDASIRTTVACEVEESGSFTVPYKLLADITNKLSDGVVSISLSKGGAKIEVRSGSSKFNIVGSQSADFPSLPNIVGAKEYKINAGAFSEMVRMVSYAASKDDTRRILKSAVLAFRSNGAIMVATDGRRLSLIENPRVVCPEGGERELIIPSLILADLVRFFDAVGDTDVTVLDTGNQLCFVAGETEVYTKLFADAYPNYRQVIPASTDTVIEIDRQMLLDAIDRVSVLAENGDARSVEFLFQKNICLVSADAGDRGLARDEIPVKYEGKPMKVRFNPQYISEPVSAISDDTVKLCFTSETAPVVISCSVPFTGVVMPMRTS